MLLLRVEIGSRWADDLYLLAFLGVHVVSIICRTSCLGLHRLALLLRLAKRKPFKALTAAASLISLQYIPFKTLAYIIVVNEHVGAAGYLDNPAGQGKSIKILTRGALGKTRVINRVKLVT